MDYPFPILYIFVLQVGQVPFIAGLPFFMVTDFGFFISLLVLHFLGTNFFLFTIANADLFEKCLEEKCLKTLSIMELEYLKTGLELIF